ncbi:MAG: hypothetical protein WA823_03765 [Candidatus Acidiferrales bacterium]
MRMLRGMRMRGRILTLRRMRVCVWVAAFLLMGAGGAVQRAEGQAATSAQGTQGTQAVQSSQAAQASRQAKTPSRESLFEAHKAVQDLFSNLSIGNTEEAARWMADEVGSAQDDDARATLRDNFRSKLDALLASPPVSPYGKLSGYDLVDESYLPNSARYFRLIYITYHEGSPLMWQFRFYAKPDGKVALENVEWSEKNPFEYMSAPEMLYPKVVQEK